MIHSNRRSFRSLKALVLAGSLFLPAASALGDTIYILSGRPPKQTVFPMKGMTISDIRKDINGESLYFTTQAGRVTSKPLESIVQIEADGETMFNQAEAEFAKNDLKAAGADYRKAMASTSKEWVKHRSDVRLLTISSQTGDFLGAVEGFVQLARKDPTAAGSHKPAIATAPAAQLDSAIGAVNKGRAGAGNETLRVLLPFLIELYNKHGDTGKSQAVLDELTKLQPATVAGQNNTIAAAEQESIAKQAQADLTLTTATKAFEGKQYDAALQQINSHRAAFADPDHQARALYLIAEIKAAQATTDEAWLDAALAYMRVVANFKGQPSAADALYKTGTIEEKLKKPTEASAIYNQVVTEYKDTKAAQDAQAAIARLKQ